MNYFFRAMHYLLKREGEWIGEKVVNLPPTPPHSHLLVNLNFSSPPLILHRSSFCIKKEKQEVVKHKGS